MMFYIDIGMFYEIKGLCIESTQMFNIGDTKNYVKKNTLKIIWVKNISVKYYVV